MKIIANRSEPEYPDSKKGNLKKDYKTSKREESFYYLIIFLFLVGVLGLVVYVLTWKN